MRISRFEDEFSRDCYLCINRRGINAAIKGDFMEIIKSIFNSEKLREELVIFLVMTFNYSF